MAARMIDVIATANRNLAGFGCGAMYPLLAAVLMLVPTAVGSV